MLGYTDTQGNFYVYDNGRNVHLEHQRILSSQPCANSIAYISSNGTLHYYAGHAVQDLDISNPNFYYNTDNYLYYSLGGSFSLYNGKERKYLGYIQNNPYAFGDSIAGMHDYSEYFFAYYKDRFIELEQHPVQKVIAGDNILAYIDHLGQMKIFYQMETTLADDYIPIAMQAGANTVAFIDNYQYLKVFYAGHIYELYNVPDIYCLEIPGSTQNVQIDGYCNGPIVYDIQTELPLFQTGDDLVAYLDESGRFYVFYKGNVVSLDQQEPEQYTVTDNLLWYIDSNNFLKVFSDGELYTVETYRPENILADKDIIVYTDLDKRLKAFYKGEHYAISDAIVLDFALNNALIMYSSIPNRYQFYSFEK
ncbi:MAG: hypothetical protein R2794_06320 [Chitinophagales bacterium]